MSIDDRLPAEPDVGRADGHDGAAAPTRRGFMKAVGLGGALVAGGGALLPFLADEVSAQSGSGGLDDSGLLQVAMTLEYAASQLYEDARGKGSFDEATTNRIVQFGPNHQTHGDSIADMLTTLSTDETFDVTSLQVPNAKLYKTFHDRLDAAADATAALGVLQDLESTLAATLQVMVTTMTEASDARFTASIQMVDAQQEVVLARLLSRPLAQYTPTAEPTEGALSPEAYK